MKVASLYQRMADAWVIHERRAVRSMEFAWKHVAKGLGDKDAHKLKPDDIRQYVLARKQAGAKNATINMELAILRRAFNLAYQAEVINRVPHIEMLEVQNVRQGTWSAREVQRVCAHMAEWRGGQLAYLVPVVQYAYLTGRRTGEILQLEWQDVDLDGRVINVRQSTAKNGEPDQIPLEGALYQLMAHLYEQRRPACPLVFHQEGGPIIDLDQKFRRAVKRVGLEGKRLHDFRRTMATDLTNAGVDMTTSMRVTGHKTDIMFRRYRIVAGETVRGAMASVQEFRTGEAPRRTHGQRLAHARELWPELP